MHNLFRNFIFVAIKISLIGNTSVGNTLAYFSNTYGSNTIILLQPYKKLGVWPYKLATTVETRYNECSRDPKNSYVITSNSLYALHMVLFSRVGTQRCIRYIEFIHYSHVRYSKFPLYYRKDLQGKSFHSL